MISRVRRARSEAGVAQSRGDVGDEVRIAELARRQVDRDREVERWMDALLPIAGLAARPIEDPAPDVDDESGLFRERDELQRSEQPAARMLPAYECLEPVDPAGRELDGGLVVHDELVALQRAAQIGFELQAVERGVVQGRLEPAHAGFAVALGEVHGHVGVADQLVGSVAGPVERDARARGHDETLARQLERLRERAEDPLGLIAETIDRRRVFEQDRELVAAEPRDRVAGPHRLAEAVTDRDQRSRRRRCDRGCRSPS